MTRPVRLFLVIAVAATFAAAVALLAGTGGHSFQGRCTTCHVRDPGQDSGSAMLVRDVTPLCLGCHPEQQKLSHPVDIKPSMEMPSGWPLDAFGRMTCATCHAAHGKDNAYMLRVPEKGERFCIRCHDDLLQGIDLHRSRGAQAHLSAASVPGSDADDLDEVSKTCVSCHDAVVASDSGLAYLGRGVWQHGRSIGLTHPVGVAYRAAAGRRPMEYAQEGELPPEIRLPEGRVGCTTCHSVFSGRRAQVVYPMEGSRLCLACHRK